MILINIVTGAIWGESKPIYNWGAPHCINDTENGPWSSMIHWLQRLSLVGGWATPLKNDGVKVSWDDDIPNIWENKIHVPKHQPAIIAIIRGPSAIIAMVHRHGPSPSDERPACLSQIATALLAARAWFDMSWDFNEPRRRHVPGTVKQRINHG